MIQFVLPLVFLLLFWKLRGREAGKESKKYTEFLSNETLRNEIREKKTHCNEVEAAVNETTKSIAEAEKMEGKLEDTIYTQLKEIKTLQEEINTLQKEIDNPQEC